jgi:hypothetical protein
VPKKTKVWESRTQATPEGRKILDELKELVRNVLRSYVKLQQAQEEFEEVMEELDEIAVKATIPRHYLR